MSVMMCRFSTCSPHRCSTWHSRPLPPTCTASLRLVCCSRDMVFMQSADDARSLDTLFLYMLAYVHSWNMDTNTRRHTIFLKDCPGTWYMVWCVTYMSCIYFDVCAFVFHPIHDSYLPAIVHTSTRTAHFHQKKIGWTIFSLYQHGNDASMNAYMCTSHE